MWTSTDDWRCQEQVRHMRSPNCSWAQRSTCSALMASTLGSRSAGAVAKQHLLQRVPTQTEPERLERDDFFRRDVAEVDVGPEVLHEPRLRFLRRRFEDELLHVDLVRDLVHEPRAHLSGRPIDAGRAALAPLGDDLPRTGLELFVDPLDPEVRREVDLSVFRAHFGEDGEVGRELTNQLELALAGNLERPVGDLHVREALLDQPSLELVELPAGVDGLEQRSAAYDRRPEGAIERDLLLEVVRDVARAPAELDDVHVLPAGVEHPLDLAQVQALVDDVCQSFDPRLARARGQVEKSVKAAHKAPPASPSRASEHRGTANCR